MHALESKGVDVPALNKQPELYDDLNEVWSAFEQLSRMRSIGFAPSPIGILEIEAWLNFNDINDTEIRSDYLYLIQAMDACFLEHSSAQIKKKK